MTDLDVVIDKVIHEAVIIVDEVGTEAAAATAVVLKEKCIRKVAPTLEFIANRAFSYYIRDNTENIVLFQGLFV